MSSNVVCIGEQCACTPAALSDALDVRLQQYYSFLQCNILRPYIFRSCESFVNYGYRVLIDCQCKRASSCVFCFAWAMHRGQRLAKRACSIAVVEGRKARVKMYVRFRRYSFGYVFGASIRRVKAGWWAQIRL